jgi:hypothetical protein
MKTESAKGVDLSCLFSLILFSGPWPDAIGNVAFLDREDDRITLEPYAPVFTFTVLRGLSANEALTRAEDFVSRHSSFGGSKIERIIDDYERVVGYEVRPLFLQTTFGSKDILDISYRQRDNHIDIYVRLDSNIEQKL